MTPPSASSIRAVLVAVAAAVVPCVAFAPAEAAGPGGTFAQANPTSNDFYLRAGIALDWSKDARFEDEDCARPRPGNFYGCRGDGTPHGSAGDFGTMGSVDLGVGYVVSPLLRLEAGIQYRPGFSFEGHHSYRRTPPRAASADLSSLSAMLAAYLDLPELGFPRVGPFSPFVGAGIGLSRVRIDRTRLEFPLTTVDLPAGHRTNFAWMLAAGLAVSPGERTTLELAWRYTDSGPVETGRGIGRTVCRIEGCGLESVYAVPETRADLKSHGLHLSVRYAF